ncbi:hypothetical protein [Streptomyces pactum]|uniref:hypothetical protein n=1 Tax=Streptomyces pactum TaxID=68249 RepID=UPI0036FC3BD7
MHFHGYQWCGDGRELRHEGVRRPTGNNADFLSSKLPPMMNGWWLHRRAQTSTTLTWTDHRPAIGWLRDQYRAEPPPAGSRPALETRTVYAENALSLGVDVVWGYWTGSGPRFAHHTVVCCPNVHWPRIPCPLGAEV